MKTYVYNLFLILIFTVNVESQFISKKSPIQIQPLANSFQSYIPPQDSTALDSFIIKTMQDNHMVGYAACVVKNGQIKWHHNYGYADLGKNIPVTDSTIFMLASISKTILTTAIMQLWEDGLFGLDDDVNQYLPERLQVHNPYFPNDPITFKMLLTHTSSMQDNWDVMHALEAWGSDSPISLDSLLVNYFIPGGLWYNAAKNFYNRVPGTYCNYCSIGFTLLGYLVERISGESLEDYCQANIFQPLGMNNSSWFLANLDTSLIARHYRWSNNKYITYSYYGYPFYPAGQLRTSIIQLANFMMIYMNKGTFNDNVILDSLTIKDILVPRFLYLPWVYFGLGFGQSNYYSDRWLWGHDGSYYGVYTEMFFHPEERWGYICLSNTGYYDDAGYPDVSYNGSINIARKISTFAEYFDEIYALAYKTDRNFILPETQALIFQTRLTNSAGKNFSAEVAICSYDSLETDSIPIFDDGNHSDSLAGDGIWGNTIGPVNTENTYYVDLITTDFESISKLKMTDLCRFTSIGPLVLDGVRNVSTDQEVNAGDYLRFRFKVRNNGLTVIASNVTSHVVPLDTCASISTVLDYKYGNIAPGNSVEGTQSQSILFNQNCGGLTARFALDIFSNGYFFWSDTFTIDIISGIEQGEETAVINFDLKQNYPNPFNPITNIQFSIPKSEFVTLEIYNLLGQKVATLMDKKLNAGIYTEEWNAAGFASGVYLYQLRADNYSETKKLILLK